MFALLSYYLADLVFTQARTETFPRPRNMRPKHITEAKLMQPKVVAHSVLAVMLIAGCEAAPKVSAPMMDPSGLHLSPEAIVYNTNTRDVPWDWTEPNPCNGDMVAIQGTSHFVIMTGFDDAGGFHYSSNVVSKGTGLGASGKAYKINEHTKDMDQVPGQTEGYVIREIDQWLVKGPTSADDYTRFAMFKITVTANGEPTPIVENSYTKCGG
jgi:hypothetical protein